MSKFEMSTEEVQKKLSEMSPELLGSWASCMGGKITRHYGEEVKNCVDGITHSNWEKILLCIATTLGIADPEIWIPEQIALFTAWSIACIF